MLAGVDGRLLVMPEVRPHALATTARRLRNTLVLLMMELMVIAMVPEATVIILLTMAVKIFLTRQSMTKTVRCD
jgi:hypothetical protein